MIYYVILLLTNCKFSTLQYRVLTKPYAKKFSPILFAEQQKRCENVRYHKLAEKIQGGKSHIYHGDYSGWIHEFDEDKTDL